MNLSVALTLALPICLLGVCIIVYCQCKAFAIVFRLTAWVLVWIGKRFAGVDIRIKTVGVFTFHHIQLTSRPGISLVRIYLFELFMQ